MCGITCAVSIYKTTRGALSRRLPTMSGLINHRIRSIFLTSFCSMHVADQDPRFLSFHSRICCTFKNEGIKISVVSVRSGEQTALPRREWQQDRKHWNNRAFRRVSCLALPWSPEQSLRRFWFYPKAKAEISLSNHVSALCLIRGSTSHHFQWPSIRQSGEFMQIYCKAFFISLECDLDCSLAGEFSMSVWRVEVNRHHITAIYWHWTLYGTFVLSNTNYNLKSIEL